MITYNIQYILKSLYALGVGGYSRPNPLDPLAAG